MILRCGEALQLLFQIFQFFLKIKFYKGQDNETFMSFFKKLII